MSNEAFSDKFYIITQLISIVFYIHNNTYLLQVVE
jgi:hypothetical protein